MATPDPNSVITTTTTTTTTQTQAQQSRPVGSGKALDDSTTSGRQALKGQLVAVNLPGAKGVRFDTGAITDYAGFRLYCNYSVQTIGTDETLIINVGDAASGVRPSVAKTKKATMALLTVRYRGHSVAITNPVPIIYGGNPLAISAQVDSQTKWDNANVTLTIEERDLTDDETQVQVPGFIIVEDRNANIFELRWVDNPVVLSAEKLSAQPVKTRPVSGPGAGISGPMGIETP